MGTPRKLGRITQVQEGEEVYAGAGLGLAPGRYLVQAPCDEPRYCRHACLECRQTFGSRFGRDLHTQVPGRHLFAMIHPLTGVHVP